MLSVEDHGRTRTGRVVATNRGILVRFDAK
jgi:hypothetical protein